MANEFELEKIAKPVFGISSRRYRQLANEEIVPQVVGGKIDFVAAAKAMIEYYRKLAEAQGSLSLTDERTALTAIKKEREKLKLEVDRGNLVDRGQAYIWLGNIMNEAKMAFWGLPRRMAPVLAVKDDEKDVEFELSEEIRKILEEMGKVLPKKTRGRPKKLTN